MVAGKIGNQRIEGERNNREELHVGYGGESTAQ